MSWSKFTIVVAICYIAYYSFNIIFDMLRGGNSAAGDSSGEILTFTEDIQTTYLYDETDVAPKGIIIANNNSDKKNEVFDEQSDDDMEILGAVMENINASSGGVVNMADIIKLAQSDTIEFKRSLVF